MKVTRSSVLEILAVTVLIVAYLSMALSSTVHKSVTYDGIAHLTAGVSYWMHNDYRLQPENGNFPQRWMALPVVMGNFRFPSTEDSLWHKSQQWRFGWKFFYEEGNNLDEMLFRGRAAIAILGAALGLVVYLWSRRLFGVAGGMVSLTLCVFSPTILAHGRLLTSDLAAGLCFTAALGCFWAVLHKISVTRVALSCLAMGALALSKMSAPIIAPVLLVLVWLRLATNQPLPVGWLGNARNIVHRRRQFLVFAGVLAVHVIVVFTIIWAACGFRFSACNTSEPGRDSMTADYSWETMEQEARLGPIVGFVRKHRLLPEAYIYGYGHVYMTSVSPKTAALSRRAFLNGEFRVNGWAIFFPYCFLVKTPLSFFAVLLLAALGTVWKWRTREHKDSSSTWSSLTSSFYHTAPLWLFMLIYWALLINSEFNVGHRHLLPVYPAMFILAGAAAYWLKRRFLWVAVVLVAVILTFAADSLTMWPHYLAYFNQLAGGPANGYKHLVDGSLDWGQDLPGLKRWLDAERIRTGREKPVYISYFGNGSLDYYGIDAFMLPFFSVGPQIGRGRRQLTGGIYCISATTLQNVLTVCSSPWNAGYETDYWRLKRNHESLLKRSRENSLTPKVRSELNKQIGMFEHLQFGRLCAYLRSRVPDDNVGYSIMIYRLTPTEVHQALHGPVAELTQQPYHP